MRFPFKRRRKDGPEIDALIRRRVLGGKKPIASETVAAADLDSPPSVPPRPDQKVLASTASTA
jgi:hypothetical protein